MLLLLFTSPPAPPSPAFINAAQVISDLWPPLNARAAADAVFWTESEMFEWFNEAGKRLAGCGGVFVVRDTSLASVLDTPSYSLPDSHQATIQADLAGKVLRPRTVQEVEALDSGWPTTDGEPVAFLLDVEGVKTITLYPQPNLANAAKAIDLVMRALPSEVSAGSAYLSAPPALRDYFTFYILGQARAKECHAQMPEVAQWFQGLAQMYMQAVQGYVGGV